MTAKNNPVGWFEIPVTDMQRAKSFYEHVFEEPLTLNEMGPVQMAFFPMQEGGFGASGSLVRGAQCTPSKGGIHLYFTAPDIEATLARVIEKGGRVLHPKTDIGAYGFFAFLEDTEGNRIGLHTKA